MYTMHQEFYDKFREYLKLDEQLHSHVPCDDCRMSIYGSCRDRMALFNRSIKLLKECHELEAKLHPPTT